MAIAHDADSNANSGSGSVSSLTWSHTGSGSNRILVVFLAWTGTSTELSDVTYNGVAMTTGPEGKVDATSTYHTRFFYLVNSSTGAHNIVATPDALCSIFGGGVSFTGVDQTNPIQAHSSVASQSGFGTRSLAVTTTIANEWIVTGIGLANATSTLSSPGGYTEAFNQGDTTAGRRAAANYFATTSAGSYTGEMTISGSTNRSYAMQTLGLNEVGGVAGGGSGSGFFNIL